MKELEKNGHNVSVDILQNTNHPQIWPNQNYVKPLQKLQKTGGKEVPMVGV